MIRCPLLAAAINCICTGVKKQAKAVWLTNYIGSLYEPQRNYTNKHVFIRYERFLSTEMCVKLCFPQNLLYKH